MIRWLLNLFSSASSFNDLTLGTYSLPNELKKIGANIKPEVRNKP